MGTLKEKSLDKSGGRKKRPRVNPVQETVTALMEKMQTHQPELYDALDDWDTPLVRITMKMQDSGDWLCILVREVGVREEVLFSGGSDPLTAFLRAERSIERGGWKKNKPWTPPSESEGAEAK